LLLLVLLEAYINTRMPATDTGSP